MSGRTRAARGGETGSEGGREGGAGPPAAMWDPTRKWVTGVVGEGGGDRETGREEAEERERERRRERGFEHVEKCQDI